MENIRKQVAGEVESSIQIVRCALALIVTMGLASLSGCLQTRSGVKEQDEKQVLRKQVAETSSRFGDLDEDVRRLNGRVEVLEQRLSQQGSKSERSDQGQEARLKSQDEKLSAVRDEVLKLSATVEQLTAQVAGQQQALQSLLANPPATNAPVRREERPASGASGLFEQAEALFAKKAFQDAILKYEDFRKANPRNRRLAEATYKIGLAFEELKSPEEAKAFYEEVVQRFPKTREAEKAQARLRRLKKR
jgi:TolA-binding protein